MDRVLINNAYRDFLDEMKEKCVLGFDMVLNPESFLLAVALGINSPKELQKNRFGYVLLKTFKPSDNAMISAALLGTISSDTELDDLADFEKSVTYCEKCAESGYEILREKVDSANWDEELLEARLMKELEQLYVKNVEDDI